MTDRHIYFQYQDTAHGNEISRDQAVENIRMRKGNIRVLAFPGNRSVDIACGMGLYRDPQVQVSGYGFVPSRQAHRQGWALVEAARIIDEATPEPSGLDKPPASEDAGTFEGVPLVFGGPVPGWPEPPVQPQLVRGALASLCEIVDDLIEGLAQGESIEQDWAGVVHQTLSETTWRLGREFRGTPPPPEFLAGSQA
jgi:hypothetical protein